MRTRTTGSSSIGAWVLGLIVGARGGAAGYLDVQMESATQCDHSMVTWSGDDGPYHLLLTPTEHVEHAYNVWLPSIPNGTYSYNLTINQPAGMGFLLTMWGASGISRAGTTNVMTIQASDKNDTSCFLTDEEILGLYSFSFNISDTSNGYPPQCTNLSLSWPTSLESNVTGTITKRDDDDNDISSAVGDVVGTSLTSVSSSSVLERDTSSSEHHGNTSYPPSVFGVIPLGNSFSIPITYPAESTNAKYLPNTSLSDQPTTWTSDGVTNLNWTIDLAKGTRFILVAGIGSDQQWASGGSSTLLTVGQGGTGCVGGEQNGNGVPSVTSTPGHSGPSPVVRTVLACVFSVLGTLLLVGAAFFFWRVRRRKNEMAKEGLKYPTGALKNLTRAGAVPYATRDSSGSNGLEVPHTPLDLIASRDGSHAVAPILTDTGGRPVDSPMRLSPTASGSVTHSPWEYRPPRLHIDPNRPFTGHADGYPSPISPLRDGRGSLRTESMARHSSQDPLLVNPTYTASGLSSPNGNGTFQTVSTQRPLQLHDRSQGLPEEDGLMEDVAELKREVLAMGDDPGSGSGPSGQSPGSPVTPGPPARRRRREDALETEYVVHRDAGRVRAPQRSNTRVLELPPRYEELDWEEEERDQDSGDTGHSLRTIPDPANDSPEREVPEDRGDTR